ncbi:MAG: hypothetical protein JST51_12840 [Armatimonadetes bacterium]|nr:hypothetical protein [Armatimonadota bacterium]
MKFLVAVHHADDHDGSDEDKARIQAIDDLNDEMVAAGVRVFVGGLHRAETAKSLVAQPGGEVVVSDGAYLPGGEHVAGLWVLEIAGMEEALEWGRKATLACRAPVEVRQFHGSRDET